MKRVWHPEELVEHWTILPGERPLIEHKHGATRLGFAVLFKFFQYAGAFPRAPQDVPLTVRLTVEDLRALTPLIYAHVSPYGHFLLDMLTRLDIELSLDTGHGRDTAPCAPERRPLAHTRRSPRAKGQQLALF
jgi:hypothetical protein